MFEPIIFTETMLYEKWTPTQRSDGRWYCRVPVAVDRSGKTIKYKRKDIYAKTKIDLQLKRAEFIKEKIKEQAGMAESRASMVGAIEEWLYGTKYDKVKGTSFDRLEETYKNQITPFLNKIVRIAINEITKEDIGVLLNCVINKGYSYSTYKKTYDFYSAFFDYLVEEDMISKSPVKKSLLINKDKYKDKLFFIHQERANYRTLVLNKGKLSKNDLLLINEKLKLKLTADEINKGKDNQKEEFNEITIDTYMKISKENGEYSSEDLNYLSKKFGVDVNQRFAELFFSTLKMKDQEEIDYLSKEELDKIIDVIENGYTQTYERNGKTITTKTLYLKDAEFILFMILTGLRVGEAVALQYKDVDFEHKKITIANNATVRKNRDTNGRATGGTSQFVSNTKTKESNKTLPVSDEAISILEKLKAKEPEDYEGYIVRGETDNVPVRDSALRKRYKNLLKAAGVEERGIHTTRHTFASLMYEATAGDSLVVSSLMRHKSVSFTEDQYVHLSEKYKKNAIENIKLLNQNGDE